MWHKSHFPGTTGIKTKKNCDRCIFSSDERSASQKESENEASPTCTAHYVNPKIHYTGAPFVSYEETTFVHFVLGEETWLSGHTNNVHGLIPKVHWANRLRLCTTAHGLELIYSHPIIP